MITEMSVLDQVMVNWRVMKVVGVIPMGFFAEYLFHVADSLGFVAFYDGGFVNENENDFSFDLYADNIGFGVRFLMLGSPLKLDYGVPINTPDGVASDPQFNFSFGSRY